MTFNSTTSPSIDAFLTQPADDGSDFGPVEALLSERDDTDPLTSIAGSLQAIADAVRAGLESTPGAAGDTEADRLREAYDDLEAKHAALYDLLADVEKIVAKSTSKVSLEVKAAINAWKAPVVPAQDEPDAVTDPGEGQGLAAVRPEQPAHDAPVEAWRAYCRELRPAEFLPTELDNMNRSQIRTFLGLEQPVSA